MVILRSQNKITDFLMILAWACPFKGLLLSNIQVNGGSASESDVCRRQILTTNVYPRAVRVNIFLMVQTHYICIQLHQKELSKSLMMISN